MRGKNGNGNGNGNGHGHGFVDELEAPVAPAGVVLPDEHDPATTTDLRIYIAGAHSTGKTTLARWISRTYRLPLVTEVARSVLAELEVPLDTLRIDLDRVRSFQAEVFRRQAEAEKQAGNRYVSDRTFDNLAYACHHTTGLRDIARGLEDYSRRLRAAGSVVFFVRPHRDLLAHDGVRAGVAWDEIQKIDGMVKILLELHDVDYITIDTMNMAERARTVRGVLGALGVRPPV